LLLFLQHNILETQLVLENYSAERREYNLVAVSDLYAVRTWDWSLQAT